MAIIESIPLVESQCLFPMDCKHGMKNSTGYRQRPNNTWRSVEEGYFKILVRMEHFNVFVMKQDIGTILLRRQDNRHLRRKRIDAGSSWSVVQR